ncbi:unnamed protein product [Rodentolepis nana]|uniref:Uncharacterized protein n=1 Tax=Rodentolepis nana TaxID=102285 RepID=A0A0R3TF68_RODNA|nr:unnamed protein product [Rodentolepis nana]
MLIHDDDDYLSRIRPGTKSFYKCDIRQELYHQVKRFENRFPGLITDRILLHDLCKLGPIMSSDDKLNAAVSEHRKFLSNWEENKEKRFPCWIF